MDKLKELLADNWIISASIIHNEYYFIATHKNSDYEDVKKFSNHSDLATAVKELYEKCKKH